MAVEKSRAPGIGPSADSPEVAPPRDRDLPPLSPERSHAADDRAERAATRPLTSGPRDPGEPLVTGDNMRPAQDPTGAATDAGAASGLSDDAADRRRQIAERAYYKAQQRGFSGGSEEADWLEAEEEIARETGADRRS